MATRPRTLVVAAYVREQGRTLLTKRRPDQAMPDAWELPGGKLEDGESPIAALEREIREELGTTCRVGDVADVVFHHYPQFDLLMLVYHCSLDDLPRPVEVAAIAWAIPEELGGYELLPADAAFLARMAARRSGT